MELTLRIYDLSAFIEEVLKLVVILIRTNTSTNDLLLRPSPFSYMSYNSDLFVSIILWNP